MTNEQIIERNDAVHALLDALAYPAGRDVRKAWDTCCFLFGRTTWVISEEALKAYHADAISTPEMKLRCRNAVSELSRCPTLKVRVISDLMIEVAYVNTNNNGRTFMHVDKIKDAYPSIRIVWR